MAEIALEFVHKGQPGSIPKVEGNGKDETLVYLGERLGLPTSRVGAVGRVLRCSPQNGEAAVALFHYHGPSREVIDVVSRMGADEVRRSVALAHTDGKFFLLEKGLAHSLCGSLACV